jgi:hypothetical protein
MIGLQWSLMRARGLRRTNKAQRALIIARNKQRQGIHKLRRLAKNSIECIRLGPSDSQVGDHTPHKFQRQEEAGGLFGPFSDLPSDLDHTALRQPLRRALRFSRPSAASSGFRIEPLRNKVRERCRARGNAVAELQEPLKELALRASELSPFPSSCRAPHSNCYRNAISRISTSWESS